MRIIRFNTVTMVFTMVTALFVLVSHAQVKPPAGGVLAEPVGNAGGPIYATFEGWGPLKDGTNALLLGYFNRNKTQEIDIPIGPDNNIEPGGPDQGQPTHFLTGRQYGMFAVVVPKDFGTRIANIPYWRPVRKCVGWPMSGPPGSILLSGPIGIAISCVLLRLK